MTKICVNLRHLRKNELVPASVAGDNSTGAKPAGP